jgi:hypothetical protein
MNKIRIAILIINLTVIISIIYFIVRVDKMESNMRAIHEEYRESFDDIDKRQLPLIDKFISQLNDSINRADSVGNELMEIFLLRNTQSARTYIDFRGRINEEVIILEDDIYKIAKESRIALFAVLILLIINIIYFLSRY